MAHDAFLGVGTIGLLAALAILKLLVTSLCLGSGASGGLFTPVMSTGGVLGCALGLAWSHLWSGAPTGAYALIGAAAMISAGMQAPLAALVSILELTHNGFSLLIPMIAATAAHPSHRRLLDLQRPTPGRPRRIQPGSSATFSQSRVISNIEHPAQSGRAASARRFTTGRPCSLATSCGKSDGVVRGRFRPA